jgi:hypothetical protein
MQLFKFVQRKLLRLHCMIHATEKFFFQVSVIVKNYQKRQR